MESSPEGWSMTGERQVVLYRTLFLITISVSLYTAIAVSAFGLTPADALLSFAGWALAAFCAPTAIRNQRGQTGSGLTMSVGYASLLFIMLVGEVLLGVYVSAASSFAGGMMWTVLAIQAYLWEDEE